MIYSAYPNEVTHISRLGSQTVYPVPAYCYQEARTRRAGELSAPAFDRHYKQKKNGIAAFVL